MNMFKPFWEKVKKAKMSAFQIFLFISLAFVVVGAFFLLFTQGTCMDTIIFQQGKDEFMDFFNHISYVRNNPSNVYEVSPHACFPPLIYLMYFLFSKILPYDATVMYNSAATSPYALLLYVFYCVILGVLFFYILYRLMNTKIEKTMWMFYAIVFSNVFLVGILERGNSAWIVCILLMCAFELREHEKRSHRELALIFIALAAAIKMYPAVIGILYLIEKREKEARRLIIYGISFFVIPFFFFGGLRGFFGFIYNQLWLHNGGNYGLGSISSICNLLEYYGGVQLGILKTILVLGYIIMALWSTYHENELWKRLFLLISIMVIAPFWSASYTLIYFLIPLVVFFRDTPESGAKKCFAVLFACIFCFGTYSNPLIESTIAENLYFVIAYCAVYVINIILITMAVLKSKKRYVAKK